MQPCGGGWTLEGREGGIMKKEINIDARDSLVFQITELMDDLKPEIDNMKAAFDYLEQARNSSYTEPMGEVKLILMMAHNRLDVDLRRYASKISNIAGVAKEIGGSEES